MPPRHPDHYQQQAHGFLRRFVAARDAYVEKTNRDDTTHPVRHPEYERLFRDLRSLIAEALRARDDTV